MHFGRYVNLGDSVCDGRLVSIIDMSPKFIAIAGTLCVVLALPLRSQSGGFGLYEVSAPNAGEAYAGQSAVAGDASTAYLNPAGMTRLGGRHILLGGQLLRLSMEFQSTPGSSGGNAGRANVVPAAYFVASLTDRLRFGLSFNQPFGAALHYQDDWAGRYFIREVQLIAMDLRPSLAFRVNRRLSVGAGPSIQRLSLSKTLAVPNLFDAGYIGDGSLHVAVRDWGIGAHAGLLFEAGPGTRVGVTYRSATRFQLRGRSSMNGIGPVMAGLLAGSLSGVTPLQLPQSANVSLFHALTYRLALLADGGWTNWRHFGQQTSKLPDGSAIATDANWRDTWRAGAGVRYRLRPKLGLQAGASFDSSPVSDWNRTPEVPVSRQIRLAAGVRYTLTPSLTLGASYTHLDLGSARIVNLQDPMAGSLSGRYSSARLPILAFTLTVSPHERSSDGL